MIDRVLVTCEMLWRTSTPSSTASPISPETSVCGDTRIWGCRSIWSIRYRDIDLGEGVPADEDVHLDARAGEKQGGLPGRVPSAHDDHGLVRAGLGLHLAGGVVNADTLELGQPVKGEPVVAGTGGDDHRFGVDHVPVLEPDLVCSPRARRGRSPVEASLTRTPNFLACRAARAVSSSPERPAGKPR